MKREIAFAFCAICGFAAMAVDWTYTITSGTAATGTKGTFSDGEWTFAASVAKNTSDLTVGTVSADPGANATLDLSKPITDADANTYTLVTLNPSFSTYANKTNLKTLKLPSTGLVTISANAFNGCTSLTSVSPFLPDSVTTVGNSAFKSVPVEASLSLKGVVTVDPGAFWLSSITDVTFGSALKTLGGGWLSGCFGNCANMTNVTFDAEMSGATLNGEQIFGVYNVSFKSKLSGTFDLRGFTSIVNRPFYNYGGSISKLMMSSSIASVANSTFHSLHTVKEVTFDGDAPAASVMNQLITAINDGAHTWSDVYFIVPEANKDSWAPYCENDTINYANSYFDPDLVPKAKTSNIYLIYKKESTGGEKGYWVYDGTNVASTNGLWSFAATKAGASGLVVGGCVTYPETAGLLDFSQKVTDEDGEEMVFASYANTFHTGSAQIAGYDKVTSVKFSDQSTSIGANAFRGCTALAGTLTFTDMISSIGDYAFQGCTGITALKLGSNFASINKYAFANCAALEEVTPCFPDSLAALGVQAFRGCPITNACVMNGIETIGSSAIRGTKIPSIYVGPRLETINGGYENGGIYDNAELTNITFDAAITNATMPTEHALAKNPKLAGTIDLRGFCNIGNSSAGGTGRILDWAVITNIIFGADIKDVPGTTLEGLFSLQSITFMGDAPKNVTNIFNQTGRDRRLKAKQDVITYVYKAHKDSWKPYAANSNITSRSSTWARDYISTEVTDLSLRRLILADPDPAGVMLILR